ncbi:carboxylase:pyruvate/acetyl-coa/propionyl-CoA [Pholiota conissans]|uniref:Carboxylase:pyruvate/acetyl-coa/propionyl-CoA n=1 Tax=Pholiota conissans TaxID=109636 RepID=A0A9P6CZC6_9AGAR|nr:carboxylase:pyruvate/acetyl-coa/propionyl-CoA [Pholiota conissans]
MHKLLVANRGEIAIRILRSASELGWTTVAIYTANDGSHASFANEAVELETVADFMKVETIVDIAGRTNCTHIHPGYGFLSESPALPRALAQAGSIIFIGPSPEALEISSDKMLSRNLATSLGVNIASGVRVKSAAEVRAFASSIGYPVIIKALDGGGGRGIRVVDTESGVEEAFKRCLGESPSKQVFVERALTGPGWKHIEVQIIGDGKAVNHLWERECSVQRRFQKIVEMAPSLLSRQAIQPIIDASLKLASHLKYKGLGTFEYLFNVQSREWVFLEINPRVQVEHTITEEINDVDLVRAQLLLFIPGTTLSSLNLSPPPSPPTSYAIQLRLTAEDPSRAFQLSPGPISASDVSWPAGWGVRIDTWLEAGPFIHKAPADVGWVVGTEYDSLLAKIIVRGRSFDEVTSKARRALRETYVGGNAVKTNIAVLAGVIDHPDWASNAIDTLWLERNAAEVLKLGNKAIPLDRKTANKASAAVTSAAASGILLQPGTLFNLTLSPSGSSSSPNATTSILKHTLTLNTIAENAFPSALSGTIQTSFSPLPLQFFLSQSTSAAVSSDAFEFADLNDPSQVASPMTGKIVELHPALSAASSEARAVRKGEALVVLSVMKMENVVMAPFDGVVERTGKGIKAGVILGEGSLVCVVDGKKATSRL